MRRGLPAVAALILIGACNKKNVETSVEPEDSAPPREPSSTPPAEPVNMAATDFCKLVYEAPLRTLDQACSDGDRKSKRYGAAKRRVRDQVQACWSMLSHGVQHKRVTLPVTAAKRCAAALEKLPWETALYTSLGAVAECRNIALGLAGAGKPCRSSLACSPGLFCSGASQDADGICMKKVGAGDSCQLASFTLLGEPEVSCEAGLFCDHGWMPPSPRKAIARPAPKPEHSFPKRTEVSGRLPREVIQRIVRSNFGRLRLCYESALRSDPSLSGRVTVRFVIGRDGSVSSASTTSDLADASVESCVRRAFLGFSFPQPEGGIVTVSYPIVFTPGTGSPTPKPGSAPPAPPPTGGAEGATNTCLAARQAGESCRATRECAAELACVSGQCGKRLAVGAECGAHQDCDAGLRCIADPTASKPEPTDEGDEQPAPAVFKCSQPKAADAACREDDECAGICSAGKCASFCGAG